MVSPSTQRACHTDQGHNNSLNSRKLQRRYRCFHGHCNRRFLSAGQQKGRTSTKMSLQAPISWPSQVARRPLAIVTTGNCWDDRARRACGKAVGQCTTIENKPGMPDCEYQFDLRDKINLGKVVFFCKISGLKKGKPLDAEPLIWDHGRYPANRGGQPRQWHRRPGQTR